MCSMLFIVKGVVVCAPPDGALVAYSPSARTHIHAFKYDFDAMDAAQQRFVVDPDSIDTGYEHFIRCCDQVHHIKERLQSTIDTLYPSGRQTSFGDLEGRQLLERTKLFFDAIHERLQGIDSDFNKIPQGEARRIVRKKREVVDAINFNMLEIQEDIESLFNQVAGAPSLPQRTEKIELRHLWNHFVDSYSQKLPSEVLEFLNVGTRNVNRFVLKRPVAVPQLSAASEQRAHVPPSHVPPISPRNTAEIERESLLPPSMRRPVAPAEPTTDEHGTAHAEGSEQETQEEQDGREHRPRSFFGIFEPSSLLEKLETERVKAAGGARRAAESIKNLLQHGCFARKAFNCTTQTVQGLFEPSQHDGKIKTFVKRLIGGSVNLTGRFARWIAFKTRVLKRETYTTQSADKARQELASMNRAYRNQPEPVQELVQPPVAQEKPSLLRRIFNMSFINVS